MDLDALLRETFGLSGFRPGQRTVVDAVLAGRPTVAVMPTGAGKSLCYQLPAVAVPGTALVVSPLIALMKDQVDALNARGVPACSITSALSPSEQSARLDDIANGRMRLVYVAPERFRSGRFDDVLSRIQLSLLAIDEAHCISEWGHDFRPDYMRLGDAVARWRPPRLVALTATATPEVRRDIVKQLGMVDPLVMVRGFDRPNLRFTVEKVSGAAAKIASMKTAVAARRGTGTVLVYAATRKNAEEYAAELTAAKLSSRAYHAGLEDDRRARVQDEFMSGKLDVVVATNAFGMGIDKADVRLVVHADLPRSPEAYYQEAGRAGRDGLPAEALLLFQHADVRLQEYLIDLSSPSVELLRAVWRALRDDPRRGSDQRLLKGVLPGNPGDAAIGNASRFLTRAGYLRDRDGVLEALHPGDDPMAPPPAPLDPQAIAARAEVERSKLKAMVEYAYTAGCRRRALLAYFGDQDADKMIRCDLCDVCAGGGRRSLDADERVRVAGALSLVARLHGRFGRTRIAGILAGTDDDGRYRDLPEHGALDGLGEKYALDLLRVLEGTGLVVASRGEYPTIHITPDGQKVADGRMTVDLALPDPAAKKGRRRSPAATPSSSGDGGPIDDIVAERLRKFRKQAADSMSMPAYCVFSNKTLENIARARPASMTELEGIAGIGPAKVEKYGKEILAAIKG
jgi:ATP-dependent DNA helicase RecQ